MRACLGGMLVAALAVGLAACVETPAVDTATAPTVSQPAAQTGGGPVLALINAQRTAQGIAPVAHSAQLQRAADAHVRWMAQTGNLSHSGANASSIKSRIDASGFCAGAVNENIAQGQPTGDAVLAAWLGSGPHRRNLLSRQMDHAAVATARDGSGTVWWALKMGDAC